MSSAAYTCSTCGRPAAVLEGGRIARTCSHTSPIVAHLAATVSQSGGVAPRGRQ